jgi:hypothetical protein
MVFTHFLLVERRMDHLRAHRLVVGIQCYHGYDIAATRNWQRHTSRSGKCKQGSTARIGVDSGSDTCTQPTNCSRFDDIALKNHIKNEFVIAATALARGIRIAAQNIIVAISEKKLLKHKETTKSTIQKDIHAYEIDASPSASAAVTYGCNVAIGQTRWRSRH